MAARTTEKPKPRLNNLNELFKLNEDGGNQPMKTATADIQDTVFKTIPFSQMDDFHGHPFRLYEGERKADMVDSIRAKGILQPLILRTKENGRYEILSGHNRKYCGIEAGLDAAPSVIKKNLSDEDALIYVIETNMMQRAFADLLHSEKAAVLSAQHSKLFSQGKRNDILNELKRLENPHDSKGNSTSPQIAQRLRSDEKVADEYGLSKNTVARYLRIDQLIPALKARLDKGRIGFIPAVTLSFLKEEEQALLDKCIELNGFKVSMKKADILRRYSEKEKLDGDNIYLILNGELGSTPKKKRTPTYRIKQETYEQYFPGRKASEIAKVVEKALELYFTHQRGTNKPQAPEQISRICDLPGDEPEI